MRLTLIRWRLPLSYAAIAVLAALALGIILLAMLRAYYDGRERAYIEINAAATSARLAPILAADASTEVLQAHVNGYAFLLQSRVQVIDTARGLTIDSGLPTMLRVDIGAGAVADTAANDDAVETTVAQILVRRSSTSAASPVPKPPAPPVPPESPPSSNAQGQTMPSTPEGDRVPDLDPQIDPASVAQLDDLPLARTLYGFNLGPEAARDGQRSSLVVSAPILDPNTQQPIGEVRFLEGPSYGREIVLRVALSLVLAGLLASTLAAVAGWFVSRQVTMPLAVLAGATERMAAGDLTARAAVERQDEIGQLAQTFNGMAERVDTTVQTLRRFVADAAHELNTPLTALQTNLDLAFEADDADEQRRYVGRATRDAARLEQLAKDLLNLSRLEGNSSEVPTALVDLARVVGELSESYGARAEQAGLEFTVAVPESAVVVGNAGRIQQAIGNVIGNAIKFTPAGGRVEVHVAESPDGVSVHVQDNGVGIPPEDLPYLFDRFHRGRNAGAFPGSGLGLTIVRAIMTAHGGSVGAESNMEGTCVTLCWPRKSV